MFYANDRDRLFQGVDNIYDDNLEVIDFVKCKIVRRTTKSDCNTRNGNSPITAGYTYLGQMVAHDIVPSTTLHPNRPVSAKLDLDSLYDDNCFSSDEIFDSQGRFILGKAKSSNCYINDSDLLRKYGEARIPDPRNDENLIISQLHLLWLKLHNKIIDEITKDYPSKIDAIKKSRDCVIYLFNKVIQDDYLKEILHKDVYSKYVMNNFQHFYDVNKDITQIPLEFSHAAFRFGHSMVREDYTINENSENRKLKELFLRNPQQINKADIIFWKRFFNYNVSIDRPQNHLTAGSNLIDTKITCAMFEVPMGQSGRDIRDVNLEANIDKRYRIPTGKQLHSELSSMSDFQDLFSNDNVGIYNELNSAEIEVPLWPYLLSEAEKNESSKLGIIGSIIVAEVIMISMKSAKRSLDESSILAIISGLNLMNNNKTYMKDILEFLKQ